MKKPWTARRKFLLFTLILLTLFASVAVFFVRAPNQPSFSRELSPQEQEYISKLVRRRACVTILNAFASGQFGYGFHHLRDLRNTIVYAQGNQPDGKIWIHVGIPDAKQSDGYRLYMRHFLEQRDKRWRIVADF